MQPVLDGPGDLTLLDRYWRAANYLSVGQIYLLDNALLMATRSGAIDPGLLIYLQRSKKMSIDAIEHVLLSPIGATRSIRHIRRYAQLAGQ